MRYTEDELLALWKRRMGLLEQDCGCVVTHQDGADMDVLLRERLRSWYAEMLRGAPAELLPLREVSGEIQRITFGEDGRIRFHLPAEYSRVVSVKVGGWTLDVKRFEKAGSRRDRLALWPGLEPTEDEPLVVVAGRMVEAAPVGELGELWVVAGPEDGSYELDEALLAQLPRS